MTSGPPDVDEGPAGGALDGAAGGCAADVVEGEDCGGSDEVAEEDGCTELFDALDGCVGEDAAGADGVGTAAEVVGRTADDDASTLDSGAGTGAGATGVSGTCGGGEGSADEEGATVVYWVTITTGGGASDVGAMATGEELDGVTLDC
jgi:hypothetical protein